uniref:RING-type domain-containing protein n=1 Tax=viral metagenome TaxID=1070528 RepID=A0A6C0KEZ7_9ZZZZ
MTEIEDDNDNNNNNNDLECLICFEKIKYNILNHYFTQVCDCKYPAHDECLVTWLKTNNKCIICNKQIHVYKYTNYYRKSYYNKSSDARLRTSTCSII